MFECIYKIRVLYKSGNSHTTWYRKFRIQGGQYTWTPANGGIKPLVLGVDDIEAIHMVRARRRLKRPRWVQEYITG